MEGQALEEKENIRNHISSNSKTNDYRHGQYNLSKLSERKIKKQERYTSLSQHKFRDNSLPLSSLWH